MNTRREFLENIVKFGAVTAISGCSQPILSKRDAWYQQKRNDLMRSTGSNDPAETLMKKVICASADKLNRSIYPENLVDPDVAQDTTAGLKKSEEKSRLGVLDIYLKDADGIAILADYITDVLITASMSNIRLGENFRFVTRYKLQTLVNELDVRKSSDFDPRDAIKKGFFQGVDYILTGNIYSSQKAFETDPNGNRRTTYKGGAQITLQLIGVNKAEIVGTAVESIERNPLVNDWIERKSVRRLR